jgi:hypothetical protein
MSRHNRCHGAPPTQRRACDGFRSVSGVTGPIDRFRWYTPAVTSGLRFSATESHETDNARCEKEQSCRFGDGGHGFGSDAGHELMRPGGWMDSVPVHEIIGIQAGYKPFRQVGIGRVVKLPCDD